MGAPDTRLFGAAAAIDLQAASRAEWVSRAAAMVGQSCALSRKLNRGVVGVVGLVGFVGLVGW